MNQEIPDGWNKVKFKELAKQKSVRIDNPGESGFEKYVGLEHLDSGELVVKRYGSTSDVTSTMKLFNKGDILFARRNTYLKRVSVAPFDGVCSGDIIVLEPILDHIVEGFLPIFMQFEPFENKIIALSAGAFSKRIKWKQLAEEDIVIPSIEEQKKISEVLWSIEENTVNNKSLINTTEMLKNGLLNKILIKGVGHEDFKETKLFNQKIKIPDSWGISKLKDITYFIRNGFVGTASPYYTESSDGVPYLMSNNVRKNNIDENKLVKIIEEFHVNKIKSQIKKGDMLTVQSGHIGSSCIVPEKYDGCNCHALIISRFKHEKVIPTYVCIFLNSDVGYENMKSIFVGTTIKHINVKDFKDLEISLPSLKEQEKIVDISEHFDNRLKVYHLHHETLANLKKKLTNDFLSGKLIIPKEVL